MHMDTSFPLGRVPAPDILRPRQRLAVVRSAGAGAVAPAVVLGSSSKAIPAQAPAGDAG
jgi:hypothetical protein